MLAARNSPGAPCCSRKHTRTRCRPAPWRPPIGSAAGWQSTWQYYMVAFFLPYSHASEARLASLLVPGLPDSLNFIAYHRRHHIEPSRNFGLVLPTDMLWDKLLGVRTVMLSDGDATIDANKCK